MDVVIVTANGMVKRTSADEFRQQGRGGGGITAMGVADGDQVVGAVKLGMEQRPPEHGPRRAGRARHPPEGWRQSRRGFGSLELIARRTQPEIESGHNGGAVGFSPRRFVWVGSSWAKAAVQ